MGSFDQNSIAQNEHNRALRAKRTAPVNYAIKKTVVGDVTYLAFAKPGTAQATAAWQARKIDESVAGTSVTTWADGNDEFDNVATDLTALTYT